MARWALWNRDFPKRRVRGRWLCRWCRAPCRGKRENFCSADCAVEVAVRCNRTALRHYTHTRDRGVCAACDCDTRWLTVELERLRRTDHDAWLDQLRCLGFTRKEGLKSLWQADHIVPVAETGPVGLDAIQTLCTRCHKTKTREDAMATKHRKTVKHTTPAKADSPRPTRFQDPSLWLSAVSVRVETVRKQHKAPCIHCGKRPELRRLKVTRGAGRHGVTELYCIDCGLHVVARLQTEAQRAYHFLLEGAVPDGGSIRIADALFEAVKAAHKRRKAARDQRRASQDATV